MNRSRLKKLEERLNPKRDIELPIFLEVEGDYILFTDSLLQGMGINPENYPYFEKPLPPKGYYEMTQTGRRVSKTAEFIERIEGEETTGNTEAYLYLKGYEEQRIILL
jgi:hypothetical protein